MKNELISQPAKMLGLDRAGMEAERLKRLKRKQEFSDEEARPCSTPKLARDEVPVHRNARIGQQDIESNDSTLNTPEASKPSSLSSKSESSIPYPYGIVKKTYAFGYDDINAVKIESILQKEELQIALLSSWQVDFAWLSTKLNLKRTRLILVMQSKSESEKAQWRSQATKWSAKIRLCFPPMSTLQYSCMHSKLMLLFYSSYLRIVIPSANLMPHDWGDGAPVLENTVFFIDLPRLGEPIEIAELERYRFASELLKFLRKQEVDEQCQQPLSTSLAKFDFTKTSRLAFIHTINGTHHGEEAYQTGYPLLAKSINALRLHTASSDPLEIEFAASSIGALAPQRLETMHRAMKGEYQTANPSENPRQTKLSPESHLAPRSASSPSPSHFRIYYPTAATVADSNGGPDNAGTIFLSASNWDKDSFPRTCFRDYVSRRPGMLSHNKIVLGRSKKVAFLYTGSANLSQSAWGNMTWDRKVKQDKLTCGNWECGVLIEVKVSDELKNGGLLPLSVFENELDIPFKCPGTPYEPGTRPWIQQSVS